MANVDIDGLTSSSASSGRGSFSFSHTLYGASGPGRMLIVIIKLRDGNNVSTSSVTSGGTALTKLTAGSIVNEYSTGAYINLETWYLLDSQSTTATIAGTYSEGIVADEVTAITLLNVDLNNPFGIVGTATGSSNNPSVTLNGVSGAGSAAFFACGKRRNTGGTFNLAAIGMDELTNGETGTGSTGDISYCDAVYLELPAGPSNYPLNPTHSNSSQWTAVGLHVRPGGASFLVPRRPRATIRM